MRTHRQSRSLLAEAEQSIIRILLPFIPDPITPDHLTFLGFAGALTTGFALGLCEFSAAFMPVALFGLFVNWFGDSFDGSLARFRSSERPRYGFLIDHSIDLISTAFILVGLGISPYMPFHSACFALITYLLFCGFVYVKVAADGVHRLDFCGLGATEFRIMVAAWVLIVHAFNLEDLVSETTTYLGDVLGHVAVLDLATGTTCCVTICGLVRIILREAAKLRAVEPVAFPPGKVIELLKSEKRVSL